MIGRRFAVLALAAAAFAVGISSARADELQTIKSKGVLVVGVTRLSATAPQAATSSGSSPIWPLM